MRIGYLFLGIMHRRLRCSYFVCAALYGVLAQVLGLAQYVAGSVVQLFYQRIDLSQRRVAKLYDFMQADAQGQTFFISSGDTGYYPDKCRDFLAHNELELTLDVLEDAGHLHKVSRDCWWNLNKAAEVMGLRESYATLRERVRLAGGDFQQGAPVGRPKAAPSGGH